MDPVRDLDIINEELRLKDEEAFNKVYDELAKKYERGEKKLKAEYVSEAASCNSTHVMTLFESKLLIVVRNFSHLLFCNRVGTPKEKELMRSRYRVQNILALAPHTSALDGAEMQPQSCVRALIANSSRSAALSGSYRVRDING